MSFSLGGDGAFLPPRKKQADGGSGLGAGIRGPNRPEGRTSSGRIVQQSEPAFTEPGIRVQAGDQSVRLPIDTPKDVIAVAERKPKNVEEAAQSAVARASGVVIPLDNFRNLKARGAESQLALPGKVTNLRTPGIARTGKAKVPTFGVSAGKAAEVLCRLVFIVQAAKYGHTLEYGGKVYSVEQVTSAAPKAATTIDAAVREGRASVESVEACVRLYCTQASCKLPSQTGTSNVIDDTTGPQVNAQPPPILTLIKDNPGGSITPYVGPEVEAEPSVVKKKSNALWWVLGLAAAALLVKKLAAVKVIGAAVAGAPLIAELDGNEDEDEDEGGDETDFNEHEDHDGPPEARDTDEE